MIENAAREPEIGELAAFLHEDGREDRGRGLRHDSYTRSRAPAGAAYDVMPDRIESGTYLVAAAITGGRVRLAHTEPEHLDAVLQKLAEAGAAIALGADWIELDMRGRRPRAVDIKTAPYPAFPTDMQAQFCALNAVAEGTATITETIFENRFQHVLELQRLGANLSIQGNTVISRGVAGSRARRSWRRTCAPRRPSCSRGCRRKARRTWSASTTSTAATSTSRRSSGCSAPTSAASPRWAVSRRRRRPLLEHGLGRERRAIRRARPESECARPAGSLRRAFIACWCVNMR